MCLFPSPEVDGACQGAAGYARINARVEAARAKFDQADRTVKPKRIRALLNQGLVSLAKATKLARRFERKGQIPTPCGDAIRAFVNAVRSRAKGGA